MAGNIARQNNSGPSGQQKAIAHYEKAHEFAATGDEMAEARNAAATSYRVIAYFDHAAVEFEKALETCENPVLKARILRDYGELDHELMVLALREKRKDAAASHYATALKHFKESMHLFMEGCEFIECFTTYAFRGMLEYEYGNRSKGRDLLVDADKQLPGFERSGRNFVYEVNTLIRLMRASSLPRRLMLLPRALRLTRKGGQSAGSRKRVYAALLGNRIYRFAMDRARR